MSKIKFIYFDAANTLIHKPDIWLKFDEVFKKHGHYVNTSALKKAHKLTSERIKFPDNTNEDFYRSFNGEVLKVLNILPGDEILNDIFTACTYLPWRKFDDVHYLKELNIPLGIISNFNKSLKQKITSILDTPFREFIVSEDVNFAKPDKRIYEFAINKIDAEPDEILFIGDSITLDIEPAQAIGMQACLIDRDSVYTDYENRITGFNELKNLI